MNKKIYFKKTYFKKTLEAKNNLKNVYFLSNTSIITMKGWEKWKLSIRFV